MRLASFMPPLAPDDEDGLRQSQQAVALEVLPDRVVLRGVTQALGGSRIELVHKDLFQRRKKWVIQYSPLKGLVCLDHDWLWRSKSNWPSLRDSLYVREVVANLYYHDSAEDALLFCNFRPVCDPGLTFLHPKVVPVRVHDYMAQQFPPDEDQMAHNTNARLEAFAELSDIDSIVALEQQVDLLTELVAALLQGRAAPPWAQAFVQAAQAHGCQQVHTPQRLVADMAQHKARVRAAQQAFLRSRKPLPPLPAAKPQPLTK